MAVVDFFIPTRIVFGADTLPRVGELAGRFGDKVIILAENSGFLKDTGIIEKIKTYIESSVSKVILYDKLTASSDNTDVDDAVKLIKDARANVVVGVGGSIALSVAKVAASLASKELAKEEFKVVRDYVRRKRVSYIEVPTTHSVTWGISSKAYVKDATDKVRKPYVDPESYADVILVDPRLTTTLPLNYTAVIGLDGIAHAFEAYISRASTPMSDAFAVKAMEFLSINLKRIMAEPGNITIRTNLCMGGLLASLAVANSSAGLSFAIGMAMNSVWETYQPLGSAIMLPHVMEFNLTAAANKFVQIAMALGEKVFDITVIEAAIKAIEAIRKLMMDLQISQRLSEYEGISREQLDKVAAIASQYDFLVNLPRPATRDEILTILQAAY